MTDANPCEDERRSKAKALIAKFPDKLWVAHPMVDGEQSQEFVLLSPVEVLWSLPAVTELPTEPPPVKTVQLKLEFSMTARSGPGTTYSGLGSVDAGAVETFTDERIEAGGYFWRRLADGFEGLPAWIAERKADGSKVYLVNP